MAMNAAAGMRALCATTLLASACPIIAIAGPRDAAPISYSHRTPVSQAPLVRPVSTPRPIAYTPETTAIPRLNPSAAQDSWRGPVTHTGSGTLPAQRRQISFTYPGSVRTPVSLPTPQMQAQPVGALRNSFSGRATVAPGFASTTSMTAGHASLPLNSLAHVRATDTGREVVVRVTSRTSAAGGDTMTLSPYAGEMLGLSSGQSANVDVEYLGLATGAATEELQSREAAPVSPAPPPRQRRALPPSQMAAPIIDRRQQVADVTRASGIFVQIGSFRDYGHAASLAGKVTSGMSGGVKTVDLRGTTYHRVMVGPFTSRADADSARIRLSRQGYSDSFVTQG